MADERDNVRLLIFEFVFFFFFFNITRCRMITFFYSNGQSEMAIRRTRYSFENPVFAFFPVIEFAKTSIFVTPMAKRSSTV